MILWYIFVLILNAIAAVEGAKQLASGSHDGWTGFWFAINLFVVLSHVCLILSIK